MSEEWMAIAGVALFATFNIVVVVLVVNASAKAPAGPPRRPE